MGKAKIKKPLQKSEGGIAEQSSHIGTTNTDSPLFVTPLAVLLPEQCIPTEHEGSRMEKAADVEPSPGKVIGLQETDSSPTGWKRGPKISAEDIHLWLTKKGFKIHKTVKPFFEGGE